VYNLSLLQIAVIVVTMGAVGAVGILSGGRVKDSRDYAISGQAAGVPLLVGMHMGIVGGAATVGASQMSFEYGLSGAWLAIGGGLACLAMGLFYASPLRESGVETIPEFIGRTHGTSAMAVTGMVSTLAMFITVFGQVLSCIALLSATFGMNASLATVISVGLMITHVFFGGAWGAGLVGIFKSVLLYFTLAVAGVVVLRLFGGFAGIKNAFPEYPWLSLFGRGVAKDLAAALSVVIGLLSTQMHLQVMFAGRDVATCRRASFIAAVLIPPTGFVCALAGMYMRMAQPGLDASHALPAFLLDYLGPVIGVLGVVSLLLAVVGTGAGLAHSMSIIVAKDIYGRLLKKNAADQQLLAVSRIAVVTILALGALIATSNLKSMILSWAYLSLGLRGSAIFLPLLVALFMTERLPSWVGLISTSAGPLAILFYRVFLRGEADPVYVGIAASALALGAGMIVAKNSHNSRGAAH
jgi:SSS family solute:Na+ symporter